MTDNSNFEKDLLEVLRNINNQFELISTMMLAGLRKSINIEKAREAITERRQDKDTFIKIYNSCNGEKNLSDLSKIFKINVGNISRAIADWEQKGLLIKLERDGEVYPKGLTSL